MHATFSSNLTVAYLMSSFHEVTVNMQGQTLCLVGESRGMLPREFSPSVVRFHQFCKAKKFSHFDVDYASVASHSICTVQNMHLRTKFA